MCSAASPDWEHTLPYTPKAMCCSHCAPPCPTAPPAPVGPHPLTAICAGTRRCHLEHSEEPEGELALPRRGTGRARRCGQIQGGRAGSTANGMELGRAVRGTAGNMGTQSKSCGRSEGEPGRWQGKEQRESNRDGEGREERPRHGSWDRRAGSTCTLGTSCCVLSLPPALNPQLQLQGFHPAATCSVGTDDGTCAYIKQRSSLHYTQQAKRSVGVCEGTGGKTAPLWGKSALRPGTQGCLLH